MPFPYTFPITFPPTSITPFDIFNWQPSVRRVAVMPGYTDGSGNWVAEVTVETTILAHVSDISQKERQYIDPGLISQGVRKLACEASVGLKTGDRMKITENDTAVSEWVVHEKTTYTGLLDKHCSIKRESFLLRRKI